MLTHSVPAVIPDFFVCFFVAVEGGWRPLLVWHAIDLTCPPAIALGRRQIHFENPISERGDAGDERVFALFWFCFVFFSRVRANTS